MVTQIALGPLTIHVWGLMVALGIGTMLLVLRTRTRGTTVSWNQITNMGVWVIVGAFIGARLSHVFFYEPQFFLVHPNEMYRVWNGGLSSLGGIIAGTLVALWYVRHHKLSVPQYGDVIMRSMPIAWAIGRFGCFLTGMHPGIRISTGVRLDLGLIESLVWVAMTIFFSVYRARRTGWYLAMLPLLYAPARFVLDFFRARDTLMPDARYAGLTPAQYGMVVLFVVGCVLARKYKIFSRTV